MHVCLAGVGEWQSGIDLGNKERVALRQPLKGVSVRQVKVVSGGEKLWVSLGKSD